MSEWHDGLVAFSLALTLMVVGLDAWQAWRADR